MNIIADIEILVGKSRSTEKELVKLRKSKEQLAAKGADAKNLAAGSAMDASAIDALAASLSQNRRLCEDLAEQILMHEMSRKYLCELLRNRSVEVLGRARDRFNLFSAAVKGELQNRLAPFLPPLSYRREIPSSDLLPLEASRALLLAMEARVMQLKDDPVAVAEFYCAKYQALLDACTAAERGLGIRSPNPQVVA